MLKNIFKTSIKIKLLHLENNIHPSVLGHHQHVKEGQFQCPFLNCQSYAPLAVDEEDIYMDAVEEQDEDEVSELFQEAKEGKQFFRMQCYFLL